MTAKRKGTQGRTPAKKGPRTAKARGAAASTAAPPETVRVGAGVEEAVTAPAPDGTAVAADGAQTPVPQEAEADQPRGAGKRRSSPAKGDDGRPRAGKLSALDAAAKVLGEDGGALGCKELVEAMAARGYWASPAGKTPHATLYSAILREIATRGADARFVKGGHGKFALRVRA